MSFYAYAIYNIKRKIYIGHTEDLQKRIARHNGLLPSKKSSFTYKQGHIWQLLYSEEYATRVEARKREQQFKSSRGRSFLHEILKNVDDDIAPIA